jgi:hypothetical protein
MFEVRRRRNTNRSPRGTVKQITAAGGEYTEDGPEMPPIPSRNIRPGAAGARPLASAARPAPSPARPSPARPVPPQLKILLAGVDKDERRTVEATVREALGVRAASAPWSVSVVNFGGKWSVTLDGPEDRLRGLSFVTDPGQLKDAIRKAVGDGGPEASEGGPAAETTPQASTEARDSHVCEHCQRAVVVVYELRSGEPKALAPVACPRCWKIGHFEIGAWAAAGGDYRSEKG